MATLETSDEANLWDSLDNWLSWIDKNPSEFFGYMFVFLAPLLLLSAFLSYKMLQLIDTEESAVEKRRPAPGRDKGTASTVASASASTGSAPSPPSSAPKKTKSKKAD
eukprot:Opistho-2@62462